MMMSFRKQETDRTALTVIIGCGRLGSALADSLSDRGKNVIVIDENEEAFRKLSPSYAGLTLTADAANLHSLVEAQVPKAASAVIVTNNDNTNIMIAQLIREQFPVPQIICRLYDPQRACVYQELGIRTICPTALSGRVIEQLLERGPEERLLNAG